MPPFYCALKTTFISLFDLKGSVMACEYLLLNGAAINSQDEMGKTALHLATEHGMYLFVFVIFLFFFGDI